MTKQNLTTYKTLLLINFTSVDMIMNESILLLHLCLHVLYRKITPFFAAIPATQP